MSETEKSFPICDYDLDATLSSGQAFRWCQSEDAWTGVIGSNWVRLEPRGDSFLAQTAAPQNDWRWLTHYLQVEVEMSRVLASFPNDAPMQAATTACRGLRLLRQDPWECLASFILSSTKQISQIQQIVARVCERYGELLPVPHGHKPVFAFPCPARLAEVNEASLRDCKMGFRAPYLLAAAKAVAESKLDLAALQKISAAEARERLTELPGVGRKIADCVLLFAYGFQEAFPVDVWVMKALKELYFPRRRPTRVRLQRFTETYFGPNAGYAQQYLFHYARTHRSPRADKALAISGV